MATVTKKGNRWYAVFYEKETKKRPHIKLPLSIKTKREARKAAAEIEDTKEREALGLSVTSPDSSEPKDFYSFAEPILKRISTQQHPDTYFGWKSLTESFLEICGNRDISEYSPNDIEDFRDKRLAMGKSPATVKREITRLNQIFKRGFNDGCIEESPCDGVEHPKVRNPPPRWMDRNELTSFFQQCPKRLRLKFMFLVWTGVRKKEAQTVIWKDIDFRNGSVLIQNSKNPKKSGVTDYRTVPLRPILLRMLQAVPEKERKGPLFPKKCNWRREFLDVCKDAKIKEITLHNTRDTFASHLVRCGVPLTEVRDLLGHSTVKMTEKYAHLAKENLFSAIDQLRTAPR